MIIIDGQRSAFEVGNFENLEQIITTIMEDKHMRDRVVTDVLVNNETFFRNLSPSGRGHGDRVHQPDRDHVRVHCGNGREHHS